MERQHHSFNIERSGGALGLEDVIADIQDNASSWHQVLDYRFERLGYEIHPFGFINVSIATLYSERKRRRCHTQMHRLIEVREKALVV
ncbi:Uncharacterised protein [Vibrio cholerae]|uniref:Uncharacterized protein n=1 Tax=Vibrio cholerae TaxID=666 RepID=A0A656AVQ0_VIBCL|nr:Uncharacterised protein [Vibrio cholerae]